MALVVGTNSWATVAEADAILENVIGSGNWFALPANAAPGSASRETYLVSAFYWLSGAYGIPASVSGSDVLKRAQALAAQWMIAEWDGYRKREGLIAGGVEEFEWSRWRERLRTTVEVPRFIADLLIEIGAGGSNVAVQLYGEDYIE
jgi:hypothetical protein